MNRKEFMNLAVKQFGNLYNLKKWIYLPNPNSTIPPIELYRNDRYSELYDLMMITRKPSLIIFSDIDPYGEEDWN